MTVVCVRKLTSVWHLNEAVALLLSVGTAPSVEFAQRSVVCIHGGILLVSEGDS